MIEVIFIIIMLLAFFNLICLIGMLSEEPTLGDIFQDFKEHSIGYMLLYILIIPSLLLYAFIRLLMYKPFV